MQGSLFLLILMGQCSFFLCRLYKYHFIDENKTWAEAQRYCRFNNTDLASVFDKSDVERLNKSLGKDKEAWIGLHSIPGNPNEENRMWHWSLPGVEFNETRWREGEPNDKGENGTLENCVAMDDPNTWKDFACAKLKHFVCYNETQLVNQRFHLIKHKLTWQKAQSYCRENYTDLISGVAQLEEEELKNVTKSKDDIWIGLFRDTWRWSDGKNFSFRYWESVDEASNANKTCAMMKDTGKWGSDRCNETKPFFCYEDKVILIKEEKTWEEALYHCRDNYNDLVSITNPHQQRWVQERAKNAATPFVWLGLRYTCTLDFWFWVSDEVVTYKNWASDGKSDDCDLSGAMDTGGQHQWFKKMDDEKFNFICSK